MSIFREPQPLKRNRFLSEADLTLADVLGRLERDEELSPTRRRDLCSAVRRTAQLLNRDPAMLSARIGALRHGFNGVHPGHAGVSEKTVQNIKSNVLAAFRHLGIAQAARPMVAHLDPAWHHLVRSLPEKSMRYGLSRFARFCSTAGYAPGGVDDRVVDEFIAAVREATFVRNPDKLHRQTTRLWNKAVEAVEEWPRRRLLVPASRDPAKASRSLNFLNPSRRN